MLQAVRRQLVAELYENISLAILVSMESTITLRGNGAGANDSAHSTGRTMTFVLVFLMSNFILTILMVLKRMHALLTQSLKDKPMKKTA